MSSFLAAVRRGVLALFAVLLAACQAQPPADGVAPAPPTASAQMLPFAAAYPWGAALQCGAGAPASCLLAVIEHKTNQVALHQIDGRAIRRLAEHPVATHPDGVAWLAPGLFVAAVEMSYGLDFFRWDGTRLMRIDQVAVGFTPREVTVLSAAQGRYRLLATPYDGDKVALVEWSEGEAPRVTPMNWCREPWHPVLAKQVAGFTSPAVVVACRSDKQVVAIPADMSAPPVVLARFDDAPRRAVLSNDGRWLYVALELGGRNARLDLFSGALQWLASSPQGSYTAAMLAPDMVVWGQSQRLLLQRLDETGRVLESRVLPVPGFIANVLLHDLDGDGELDAVVLAESSFESNIVYGPLWPAAKPLSLETH